MKMKIKDFVLPHILRQLAQDSKLHEMVLFLYKNRLSEKPISIYLPYANKRLIEICEDPYLHDEGYDSCFVFGDTRLITELIEIRVLHQPEDNNFMEDEDGSFVATVDIDNPEFIDYLFNWIRDREYILNYGVFSLHKFTGEAYCQNNKYIFDTSKGLFRVFKAFLEDQTHILSFNQIIDRFQNEHLEDFDPQRVYQAIKDIKEKLKMTGELSNLFLSSDGSYLLKTL